MKGTISFIFLALLSASLAEGSSVRKGARQPYHHHLRCWATNGWSGDGGKDAWCRNNCYHNPSFCPEDTSDGGGCDCNCDEGDDGCPRKLTKSLFVYIYLKSFI